MGWIKGTGSGRREGGVILTLFGALFLGSADNQLLIPLVPLLRTELGLQAADLGVLFSAYALAAAGSNLLIGPLTDRYGRAGFLRAALIILALAALMTSQAQSLGALVCWRAAAGGAAGVLSTCSASIVGDTVPYRRRGRVMGWVLSSYFAALILGIPCGAWIADLWGWRRVFECTAVASLVVAAGSVPVGLGWGQTLVTAAGFAPFRNLGALLRQKEIGAALATSFLVSGGTLSFLTFIGDYLATRFRLSTVEISVVFLLSGVAAILASPVSGWLSDHWTKKRVFVYSNSLLVFPLLVLPLAAWGALLLAMVFLAGLCISFRQTSLQTLQTELVTSERRGAFLALRNGASQLGISLAVFSAGLLYGPLGYWGVTGLAALLTAAGSLLVWRAVREPEPAVAA